MTREHDAEADFEADTDRAWERLEVALVERLARLEDGESTLLEELETEERPGASPYVQLCAYGSEAHLMIRLEAVSNEFLDPTRRLSDAQETDLRVLGFVEPEGEGSPNWFLDRLVDSTEELDELASLAVAALRDVYGVAHPALLSTDGLLPDAPAEPHQPSPVVAEELAVETQSSEELRARVLVALTPFFGHEPTVDDDGDVPVRTDHGHYWIRVAPDRPVVDMFAVVARGVVDLPLALAEVNRLNTEHALVQFALVEDRVVAQVMLDCEPFVAAHLRSHAAHMGTVVDAATTGLASLDGPGSTDELDAHEQKQRRRLATRTLVELVRAEHSEGWGDELDAELVAGVCEHDRRLILELLTATGAQLKRTRAALATARGRPEDQVRDRLLRRQRSLLREALLRTSRLSA